LLAVLEGSFLEKLAVLSPPLPIAVEFAGHILSHGLQPAVSVVILPLSMTLAILETSLRRETPSGEGLRVWPIEWLSACLFH
jgi:hypothetical protein